MLDQAPEFYSQGLDLNRAFGKALREARLAKGLTHESLAERAGLHPTFISLLERGGRMPSLNTVFLLAKALDERPSALVAKLEKLKAVPRV